MNHINGEAKLVNINFNCHIIDFINQLQSINDKSFCWIQYIYNAYHKNLLKQFIVRMEIYCEEYYDEEDFNNLKNTLINNCIQCDSSFKYIKYLINYDNSINIIEKVISKCIYFKNIKILEKIIYFIKKNNITIPVIVKNRILKSIINNDDEKYINLIKDI